jgi:hypothetical protein
MRHPSAELAYLTLWQSLQPRNTSPAFSARALLALCAVFNGFTALILLKRFHGPALHLPALWLWPACAAAFGLAYGLVYHLTARAAHPARMRLPQRTIRKGQLLVGLYVLLSYGALFAALWAIKIN